MISVLQFLTSHPEWPAVQAIYHRLQAHGYKAFLAGGCVRDALLGVPANDLDVATDATPDQIEDLFEKTINVGKSFGVMRVLIEGSDIEVATFRHDGVYSDGRRPEQVEFSSSQEDAFRRDFTVNALFYDLENNQIIDYVDGQKDLQKSILKTVGVAEQRFQEDHLRLLRAARFSGQLRFDIERQTFEAIKKMASLVKTVSGERLREEMYKLLKSQAAGKGLEAMQDSGMMQVLFPFYQASWQGHRTCQQPWQYFALFFRSANLEQLQHGLNLIKVSNKERKNIEQAWQVWATPESFVHLSLGQKLKQLPKEGLVWALDLLREEDSTLSLQIVPVQKKWQQWQGQLPRPYLAGDDIGASLSGKEIGVALEKAYELQLEELFSSREQALEWLRDYLVKEVR